MAKKQQIILTHGTAAPSEKAIKDLKLGEVLVQHAADAKEAALHTILEEGNVEALVSFPSTAWVDQKIKDVNTAAGQLESTVSALQTQVDGIDAAYKKADSDMKAAYEAADTAIRGEFAAADTVLKNAYEAADSALDAKITVLDGRVEANESAIDDLVAADSALEAAYKAADAKIREDYAAADTALETKLNGEIAKKADKTTVETLSGRVDVNENAIKDLVAADTTIRGEFAAADAKIREDYAAADTALEGRVNAEVAKKADKTTVETLSGRVDANEGAIAGLVAADTAIRGEFAAADAAIRGEFAAADTALEGRVNAEVAKKADKTTVEALDTRVTELVTEIEKNEETTAKALTDLDTRVLKVYEDFAAADSALETKLNGEIAKKANQADFQVLAGRVADVEDTYVSTIKYMDATGQYVELSAVNNVIDLSGLVIDGGTY